jgi:hypothetical protein
MAVLITMRPDLTQEELDRLRRMADDLRLQIDGEDFGHLDPDRQMAYCDGALRGDELETARMHLEGCDRCRAEVEELAKWGAAPRKRTWLPYALAASLAAVAILGLVVVRQQQPVKTRPPVATIPPVTTPAPPPAPSYGNAEWDRLVRDVTASGRLAMPAVLAALQPPASHFRGEIAADDARLEPAGIVVESTRPRFTWRAEPAARYVVLLAPRDGQVVESERLSEPAWQPSSPLTRGHDYAWQLEVVTGKGSVLHPAPPHPPVRFHVLDEAAATEIADARRLFPGDHLLQAILFARHGLRHDAERELLEYRKNGRADLADALLRSIRSWTAHG